MHKNKQILWSAIRKSKKIKKIFIFHLSTDILTSIKIIFNLQPIYNYFYVI